MSATIPDTMPLEEITKATGYDCPKDLQGVTFKEATSGAGGGASVSDVQINGTSIVDGSTKIANIQPKTTIDATATDNDIAGAKAVKDYVFEDVTATIGKSSQFEIKDFKAFKIADKLLYVKFQLVSNKGAMSTGSNIMLTLSNLKNVGITNSESVSGVLYTSAAPGVTFYNKNSNTIYLHAYETMNNPSLYFTYLIPINV